MLFSFRWEEEADSLFCVFCASSAQIDPGTPPVSDDIRNLLKDECWADTLLYQYASSMFEEQAKACGA
jgi:hypothetical protein